METYNPDTFKGDEENYDQNRDINRRGGRGGRGGNRGHGNYDNQGRSGYNRDREGYQRGGRLQRHEGGYSERSYRKEEPTYEGLEEERQDDYEIKKKRPEKQFKELITKNEEFPEMKE